MGQAKVGGESETKIYQVVGHLVGRLPGAAKWILSVGLHSPPSDFHQAPSVSSAEKGTVTMSKASPNSCFERPGGAAGKLDRPAK